MAAQCEPIDDYLEAIQRERQTWDALQKSPRGTADTSQQLYGAWVEAVSSATRKAERFLHPNPKCLAPASNDSRRV